MSEIVRKYIEIGNGVLFIFWWDWSICVVHYCRMLVYMNTVL